jgi:hypothetical protein
LKVTSSGFEISLYRNLLIVEVLDTSFEEGADYGLGISSMFRGSCKNQMYDH